MEFLNAFGSKYPSGAKVDPHHGDAVLNATIIAASYNHKWDGKGKAEYEALHDAEAMDIVMIMFFLMKVQVNFNGLAKIAEVLKAKEGLDLCFGQGKSTWKVKVNIAQQRQKINEMAMREM